MWLTPIGLCGEYSPVLCSIMPAQLYVAALVCENHIVKCFCSVMLLRSTHNNYWLGFELFCFGWNSDVGILGFNTWPYHLLCNLAQAT